MELGQLYLAQPALLPGRNNQIITRVFLLSATGPGGFSVGTSRALTCHGVTDLRNGLGLKPISFHLPRPLPALASLALDTPRAPGQSSEILVLFIFQS